MLKIKFFAGRRSALYVLIFLSVSAQSELESQTGKNILEIKRDLFDSSKTETLGLSFAEGSKKVTIFRPDERSNKYNNGVVLLPFKDYLYAQWQSSQKDEDAPDTKLLYSRSIDGKNWSTPVELVKSEKGTYCTSGGWWSDGKMIVSYINVWAIDSVKMNNLYIKYVTSPDGISWSKPMFLRDNLGNPINGVIEQDPHILPSGRILTAIHLRPGLIAAPYFTDSKNGIAGWTKGSMPNLPSESKTGRELEPSWFYRPDNAEVMVFRDQKNSFKKLASISYDYGETWSKPELTDFPDSRAKQSAGNLPDGTAFQVNCPSGNKNRFPLVITLSKDGKYFDRALLIRSGGPDLQPLRYAGLYKRAGYSYPKSVIWNNDLYISYATNKEDVEISRIPVSHLIK